MADRFDFYNMLKGRRSVYSIGKDEVVPKERIEEIVELAMLHTPSAFNHQPSRAAVLFGKHHERLWEIVYETLKEKVPAENLKNTENKINGFKSGYFTILFFNDESSVKKMQDSFKLYADNFPLWAQQSIGMLQFVVWTALEGDGAGISLQHYNPLIDDKVKKEWGFPESWTLYSQMVGGSITNPPDQKQFIDAKERIRIFD